MKLWFGGGGLGYHFEEDMSTGHESMLIIVD